jgi:hypothetical protein
MIRRAIAIALACASAGCATQQEIAEQKVKSNLAVEEAHNQLLLLNVARALNRRPMYFTRFQALRGPMGLGSTAATLPLPFGPDFNQQIYNLSLTHAFDKPSFDVQIMDTQKFLQGITKPAAPKTLLYYLDQGWPQQMVLHLFIREVEFVNDEGKVTESVINYPPNKEEFAKFQKLLKDLHGCDIAAGSVSSKVPYGPVLPLATVNNLQHLVQMKTADLTLAPVDANNQEIPKGSSVAVAGYQLMKVTEVTTFKPIASARPDAPACLLPRRSSQSSSPAEKLGILSEKRTEPAGPEYVRFVIRSPEAMLYYLGELARAQSGPNDVQRIPVGAPRVEAQDQILFQVLRGRDAEAAKPAVKVVYEGETYVVPQDAGRSTHVLSLVSQILNLQNEGAEVPSTATVRVQ